MTRPSGRVAAPSRSSSTASAPIATAPSGSRSRRTSSRPCARSQTQFIVKPGHQIAEIEIVVLRTPLYLVVEKTGEAAEYVTEKLDDG